jgi:glutathione S-transferase
MIRLLGRATSGNVQKILFMLEELGIPYEREDFGRQFGNTATAEYLAMNPAGKVPTLVDGEVVVWESNTILRYLAATQGKDLAGGTPAEASVVERWMDFLLAAINPGYMAAFKNSKLPPAERAAGYDEQVKDLVASLAVLDRHVTGKKFFALGKLTIADIALAPIVKRCLDFPLDRPSFVGLEAWMAGIAGRAAFKTATGS